MHSRKFIQVITRNEKKNGDAPSKGHHAERDERSKKPSEHESKGTEISRAPRDEGQKNGKNIGRMCKSSLRLD